MKQEHIKIGLWAVVAIIVIAAMIYATRAIKGFFGLEETKKVVFEDTPFLEDVPISADFEPASFVAELHDAIETNRVFSANVRCEAYQRYYETLNDNEFIAVANAYQSTYEHTLRSAINNTLNSGCSIFSTAWEDMVMNRMNKLHIP